MEQVIVPDITVPGAYDEAVQGVQYVIHAASPYAAHTLLSSEEYETDYIQPAVAGTVGMLDSAVKESGIKRVVITASVLSIMSLMTSAQEIVVDGMQDPLLFFLAFSTPLFSANIWFL